MRNYTKPDNLIDNSTAIATLILNWYENREKYYENEIPLFSAPTVAFATFNFTTLNQSSAQARLDKIMLPNKHSVQFGVRLAVLEHHIQTMVGRDVVEYMRWVFRETMITDWGINKRTVNTYCKKYPYLWMYSYFFTIHPRLHDGLRDRARSNEQT